MVTDINNIIGEMCQVSAILIRKAGEGKEANPEELVKLTQIIDNWKFDLEKVSRHSNKFPV